MIPEKLSRDVTRDGLSIIFAKGGLNDTGETFTRSYL